MYTCTLYVFISTNREQEEDLEKRQFFLNRNLRSLAQIPGQSVAHEHKQVLTNSQTHQVFTGLIPGLDTSLRLHAIHMRVVVIPKGMPNSPSL